ncbi:MAG: hypothetical protein HZA94_02205 [Candidatus Vogelbacteria bacterium]|nr:hypothetical protein [Candidatus Vogelbacteria bacterium]
MFSIAQGLLSFPVSCGNLRDMSDTRLVAMFSIATDARLKAQAPYSNFLVGAAVESHAGGIYRGCNVERCSHTQSTHAEQNAIDTMITNEGSVAIKRLVLVGAPLGIKVPIENHDSVHHPAVLCPCNHQLVWPCGHCRQIIWENCFGDSDFELEFSNFIEGCNDVISFSKNFQNKEASALRIEYKNSEGFIANYYPVFFVKKDDKTVYIVETKGREEEDDKLKFERLRLWCEDVNNRQNRIAYKALYIKQEEWDKYKPKNFDEAVKLFEKQY